MPRAPRATAPAPLSPLAQFRSPLDKAESFPLFSLLAKYSPEGKAGKEARLEKQAAEKVRRQKRRRSRRQKAKMLDEKRRHGDKKTARGKVCLEG